MNKKTLYFAIAAVVLIAVIGIIIAMQGQKEPPAPIDQIQKTGVAPAKTESELNERIAAKLNLKDGQLPLRVTMDDNGQTLSATPGKNLSLMLGTDYDWTITSSNDNVLAKRTVALDDARVQAVYQVVGEGKAVLSAQGKCKSGAKCAQPTATFKFNVDGLISENVTPEDMVK